MRKEFVHFILTPNRIILLGLQARENRSGPVAEIVRKSFEIKVVRRIQSDFFVNFAFSGGKGIHIIYVSGIKASYYGGDS